MNKFGIIRGDIGDQYSKLGKAISDHKNSFVGIFYSSDEHSKTTILYRTFDGTRITYFGSYMSVEDLVKSDLVSSIETLSFNEENWLADERDDNLHDRFCRTINRVLISSNSHRDYSSLLKFYAGMSELTFSNGYQIVNDIILATIGTDISEVKNCYSRSLMEGRYFNHWENIKTSINEKSCLDQLNIEVRGCFSQLFQAFTELLINDKEYSKRINEMIENRILEK